jgi:hypothetical protein
MFGILLPIGKVWPHLVTLLGTKISFFSGHHKKASSWVELDLGHPFNWSPCAGSEVYVSAINLSLVLLITGWHRVFSLFQFCARQMVETEEHPVPMVGDKLRPFPNNQNTNGLNQIRWRRMPGILIDLQLMCLPRLWCKKTSADLPTTFQKVIGSNPTRWLYK